MSELSKLLWVVILIVSVIGLLVGYNLYTNSENRKLYVECLRITERLLDGHPNRISAPYCRL